MLVTQRLGNLIAPGEHRIERGNRLLTYHCESRRATRAAGAASQDAASITDFARGAPLDQAGQQQRPPPPPGDCFPGAGFSKERILLRR